MFTYFRSYGVADCTDGTSSTIAYAEVLTGKPLVGNLYRGNSTRGIADPGAVMFDISDKPAVALQGLQACADGFKAGKKIADNKGQLWAFGARTYSLFQTIQTPNDPQYRFGSCQFGCDDCGLDQSWSVDASSQHSGGANVLMGDGSVRFIKDSINRTTWWKLGTKANGESLSGDSY